MPVETTQMSINGWVDEENVVYPCNGLLAIKRNGVLITRYIVNEP